MEAEAAEIFQVQVLQAHKVLQVEEQVTEIQVVLLHNLVVQMVEAAEVPAQQVFKVVLQVCNQTLQCITVVQAVLVVQIVLLVHLFITQVAVVLEWTVDN